MKKILNIFVILLLSLCFIGCGSSTPTKPEEPENPDVEQPSEDVYYTVSFKTNDGDEINETKVKEGQTVSKPVDPSKKDSLFFGWYLDSECETKAEFPLSVNKDTTVYALFVVPCVCPDKLSFE